MANSKNGSIREIVIDKCLSDKENKYGTMDIMKACNKALADKGFALVTAPNTIRYDMEAIAERWGAYGGNIVAEKIGKNVYYHYESETFSIYNSGLLEEELNKLKDAMQVLSRFKGVPQYEWLEEVNARFKAHFMTAANAPQIINFNDNAAVEGRQHLTALFDAICQEKVLNIAYKPFATEPAATRTVHPYHLKAYNNRWYLLAWDEAQNSLCTLALDGIEQIDILDKEYIPNRRIDFATYFDAAIGIDVHPEQPTTSVKLWVAPEQYPALMTQPLHSSQQVVEHWDDGSKVIRIEVQENEELIQKLLSFGEKVVVMEPQSIKQKIQGHIWVSGERYAKY